MADLWLEPYAEALGEFPVTGSVDEQLRAALARAVRAPSVHNTQPWWCRIGLTGIEIGEDRSRRLEVSDPDGREAMISCGAFVEYLTITLRRFGRELTLVPFPLGVRNEVVARLELLGQGSPDSEDAILFGAIPSRGTNRGPYRRRPVPADVIERAVERASTRHARLLVVSDSIERSALAEFVAEGDRIQLADAKYRRELAHWLRTPLSRRRDGIPSDAGKAPRVLRPVAPAVTRRFDISREMAARDRRVAAGSPVLAILFTRRDDRLAWFEGGRALARTLLSLASDGIATSFLNQPLEVPELRAEMTSLFGRRDHPQIVIRAGYADPVPETPRRPLSSIIRR